MDVFYRIFLFFNVIISHLEQQKLRVKLTPQLFSFLLCWSHLSLFLFLMQTYLMTKVSIMWKQDFRQQTLHLADFCNYQNIITFLNSCWYLLGISKLPLLLQSCCIQYFFYKVTLLVNRGVHHGPFSFKSYSF